MPKFDPSIAKGCVYKSIAASQTTAQVSRAGDGIPGNDYLERVIITAASTAAPGVVTIFDGTTALTAFAFVPAGMTKLTETIEFGVLADSTKGFNITTGTSVSCVAVGRF